MYFYEKPVNESSNEYNFDEMREKYENGTKYEIKDKYFYLSYISKKWVFMQFDLLKTSYFPSGEYL